MLSATSSMVLALTTPTSAFTRTFLWAQRKRATSRFAWIHSIPSTIPTSRLQAHQVFQEATLAQEAARSLLSEKSHPSFNHPTLAVQAPTRSQAARCSWRE